MTDTFAQDLAQEPERLEAEVYPAGQGGRYWPHLVFATPMGFRPLLLDLTVPDGATPRPLVVFIHGGGWYLGTPKYSNPTLRGVAMMERLHAAGYAVARISYRLTGEARWPTQLHDCKAAVRFLRAKADLFGLDPDRFAVLGESAGGHLSAMVALTGGDPAWDGEVGITGGSSAVKAAVNWYGVMDMVRLLQDGDRKPPPHAGARPEELLVGAGWPDAAEAFRQASPVAHVHPSAPPFLHQHGDSDRVVPLEQAHLIHATLQEAGVTSELDVVEGGDHCFWGAVSPAIMDRALRFLDSNV